MPRAMFYLGLHEAQSGDARAALERWLALERARRPERRGSGSCAPRSQRVAHRSAGLAPTASRPARRRRAPERPRPPPACPARRRTRCRRWQSLTPAERQQAIRGMVEGLDARLRAAPPGKPAGPRRLAAAGQRAQGAGRERQGRRGLCPGRRDRGRWTPAQLADWAEAQVRLIAPGAAPPPEAVAVLERLEKAEPRNALALFYLGAASFAAGDKPAAARRWKTLLALLPADAPIRAMLEGKIKEAE